MSYLAEEESYGDVEKKYGWQFILNVVVALSIGFLSN